MTRQNNRKTFPVTQRLWLCAIVSHNRTPGLQLYSIMIDCQPSFNCLSSVLFRRWSAVSAVINSLLGWTLSPYTATSWLFQSIYRYGHGNVGWNHVTSTAWSGWVWRLRNKQLCADHPESHTDRRHPNFNYCRNITLNTDPNPIPNPINLTVNVRVL